MSSIKNSKDPENITYSAKLKEFVNSDILKKCGHCSMCRDVCPIYLILGTESSYPAGKLRVFRTFVKENYKIQEDFLKIMALCTTCRRCEEICPISLNYVEILERIRKEIVSKIGKPFGNQLKFVLSTISDKNPYGELINKRNSWIPDDIKILEKGANAYFVGCTSSYREIESAINTSRILTKIIKEGIVVLGNSEYCCGSPLIRTGQIYFDLSSIEKTKNTKKNFDIKELITHNIEELKSKGVKNIIFNCSGCYKTVSMDWPKIYEGQLPFRPYHITQFLVEKIERNEIKFKQCNKKITYHDPCHLGRHMGIYDEPRKIITSIPGVQLIEMKNSREKAMCCGAGGGLKAAFADESLEIAKLRIKEAMDTKADMLVTSCVFCKRNLIEAAKSLNSDIKVLNIEDIAANLIL